MNTADVEAELHRIRAFADTDNRRRQCMAMVRLDELHSQAVDLAAQQSLINRIVSLRREIKATLERTPVHATRH
ncbi:hypothetical protein [Nakamurella deserti]|uniref:hypothetical protein n=1 Tax=Nakamurella deserti TaxID=2164074 RepID=UPI000DBE2EC9|nr:hypothetical protein [Nakamurella deserti]